MDQVFGAGVRIDISLNGEGLRIESVRTEASIQAPREVQDEVEHAELNQGPDGLGGHRAHDGRAHNLVPDDVEIGLSSDEEDKRKGSGSVIEILEAGVVEDDQDGSVNELADKDGDHSIVGL